MFLDERSEGEDPMPPFRCSFCGALLARDDVASDAEVVIFRCPACNSTKAESQ